MDIDILEEDENPMLHRTDVRFEVTHEEATPSRLSVRDSLAAMLNKDAPEVVVHELDTKFGMRRTVGYAKVYETPEHAQEVEQDHMLRRNKITADGEIEAEPEPEAAEEEAEEETADEEAEVDAEEETADEEAEVDAEEETADEEGEDVAEEETADEEAEVDAEEETADEEGEDVAEEETADEDGEDEAEEAEAETAADEGDEEGDAEAEEA